MVGTLVALLVAAVGIVLFVLALVVICTVFVLVLTAALCAVAVRGLVHALSARPGGGPVGPGGFRPASVIESTATVIRRTAPKSRV